MRLTKTQKIQEKAYFFPYHYIDFKVDLYKKIYNVFAKVKREILIDLANLNKNSKVLDVGCGDGRFCYVIYFV